MKVYYMYICYPIIRRNDKKGEYIVSFNEMESFKTIKEAEKFCKENYASYLIAVEVCDKDLLKEL